MIPKIIHQIWVGPNKIPEHCLKYIDSVKNIHPEYQHILWTEDNLPELPKLVLLQYERYGKQKKYAFQADVLRYYLVNLFGGMYLDVDFHVFKNLSPLLKKNFNITIPMHDPETMHWICNNFFASIPNHPILEDIITNLKNESYHGPIFFGSKIKKFLNLPTDKSCNSLEIFNKCKDNEFIECVESKLIFQEFAKHDALQSWL